MQNMNCAKCIATACGLEHKVIFNTHLFQTLPLDLGEGASTLCDVSVNAEGNASGTVDN